MKKRIQWRGVGVAALIWFAAAGRGAEVTRAQFTKAELDGMGYPTNDVLATALGQSEARRDLSNGVVRLPMYGLPAPWSGEYDRILESKYQIGRHGLGGCIVTGGLVAYATGYSEVSRAFIERKHGTNIWAETRAAAERAWQTTASRPGKEEARPVEYRIRAGDTLSKIAREQHVTLKALQEANPGLDPNRLRVGHPLRLPKKVRP